MKVIQRDDDGATLRLTNNELGLLLSAGTEFTQGQYAPPTDEIFEDLMDTSREEVIRLFESLTQEAS